MRPDNPDTARRLPTDSPPEHTCELSAASGFPCGQPAFVHTDGCWYCGRHFKAHEKLRLHALKHTPPLPGMPPPPPKETGKARQSGMTKPHQGGHAR
jgi:hypothetical protein